MMTDLYRSGSFYPSKRVALTSGRLMPVRLTTFHSSSLLDEDNLDCESL
jgi:hypothetical protein